MIVIFFLIGCGKKSTEPENVLITVTDRDGNTYKTVKIGNQWWMAENLKVTHYQNGDPIPNITNNKDWSNLTSGAYCSYDNADSNIATYGLIYNWFAVSDTRNIAPIGWHVPSDEDWKQLEMYLGMSQSDADVVGLRGIEEGGKLKEAGLTHWASPNTGATNESGFTALPGGYRTHGGGFYSLGYVGGWWSSTEEDSIGAYHRALGYDNTGVAHGPGDKQNGSAIRCVKY
jgi:uncharacterized protein (TIGR02145 family)